MEVKEFIKTILKDVNEGVAESDNEQFRCYLMDSTSDGYIEFDLAVVSKKEASGKIGAEILGIGILERIVLWGSLRILVVPSSIAAGIL